VRQDSCSAFDDWKMKKWLSFVTYPKDATNTVAPWQLLEAGGYKEMSSI
jgi:hypothetical protein